MLDFSEMIQVWCLGNEALTLHHTVRNTPGKKIKKRCRGISEVLSFRGFHLGCVAEGTDIKFINHTYIPAFNHTHTHSLTYSITVISVLTNYDVIIVIIATRFG